MNASICVLDDLVPVDLRQTLLASTSEKISSLVTPSMIHHISFWLYESPTKHYSLLSQLSGRKPIKDSRRYSSEELAERLLELFPSKPSPNNPAFLNIYTTTECSPDFQQRLTSRNVSLQFHSMSADLASYLASSFLLHETSAIPLLDLAYFSLLACPDLIDFRSRLQVSEEKDLTFKELPGEVHRGMSLMEEPVPRLYRILSRFGRLAWLSLSHRLAQIKIHGPLSSGAPLVYKEEPVVYWPKLLMDERNEYLHQLYLEILDLDAMDDLGEAQMQKLTKLLDSYKVAAKSNDPKLFPDLAENPQLRERAIAKATDELKRVMLANGTIRNHINHTLRGLEKDIGRVEHPSRGKKTKLEASILNDAAFAEFKTLVPYLDLACTASAKNSERRDKSRIRSTCLDDVYWRVRNEVVFERRLLNRKYWE